MWQEFVGDLPVGHGKLYPCLLHKATGTAVSHNEDGDWYADWLEEIYEAECEPPLSYELVDADDVVILPAIDRIYGHAISRLLRLTTVENQTAATVVAVVPERLAWLVPDNVAAWTIELPMGRNNPSNCRP